MKDRVFVKLSATAALMLLVTACATTAPQHDSEPVVSHTIKDSSSRVEPAPAQPVRPQLPMWVMAPETQVDDGAFASTECVVASDDFGMDKAEATANARAELSKQVEIRVKAMDKTYKERVKLPGKKVSSSNFESVSKQLSEQSLRGSRVVKLDYVMVNDRNQLCVMVELSPKKALALFKEAIDDAKVGGTEISTRDEDVLYQEFKAKRAIDELEASLKAQ